MHSKSLDINNDDDVNSLCNINIDLEIVAEALSIAKNNKAQGVDGITNELLKNGGDAIQASLVGLFNKIVELEKIPSEWNMGIIVPIFKKGDRKDLNNYRGISLTSCVSKIFNRVIAMHISSFPVQGGLSPM